MAGDKGSRAPHLRHRIVVHPLLTVVHPARAGGTEIQKGYNELEAKRLETNKRGNKPTVNAGRKAPDPTALGLKS